MIFSNEQAFNIRKDQNGDTIITLKTNENATTTNNDINLVSYHTPRSKRNN